MEDRIGAVLVGIAEGVARQVEDDEFGQRLEVLHLLELPQPVVADVDLHQRRQLGERAQARHVIVFAAAGGDGTRVRACAQRVGMQQRRHAHSEFGCSSADMRMATRGVRVVHRLPSRESCVRWVSASNPSTAPRGRAHTRVARGLLHFG
eukprot:4407515-Prymnesium_polylepis.1